MNLMQIAWRSLKQRSLSSFLTAFSMSLGVALVVMVLVILNTLSDTFHKNSNGWDMIVGAKGSKLQLVLNTVFHLSTPVENIPYWYYKDLEVEFAEPGFVASFGTATVIPVCMGDSYRDHRVIATIPRMFEVPYSGAASYQFAQGRNFVDEPGTFEAVIGAVTASRTGLKLGDDIHPTHGISQEVKGHEHGAFTVVGILAPTGTPADRAVYINMEGFYLQEGHELSEKLAKERAALRESEHADDHDHNDEHKDEHKDDGDADHDHKDDAGDGTASNSGTGAAGQAQQDDHDHASEQNAAGQDADHDHADHDHDHDHEGVPEELREVTSLLIRFDPDNAMSSLYSLNMQKETNKGSVAQAVLPLREITNLFDTFITPLKYLLMFLALLIVIVSGIGIMVSIYNTMNDRRRDIAVMRALGAGRATVMFIILTESLLLALGGGIAGFLVGHLGIGLVSWSLSGTTGVEIPIWYVTWEESVLLPGLVVLATLAGIWPAVAAYRTDVSRSLSATP